MCSWSHCGAVDGLSKEDGDSGQLQSVPEEESVAESRSCTGTVVVGAVMKIVARLIKMASGGACGTLDLWRSGVWCLRESEGLGYQDTTPNTSLFGLTV